MVHTLCVKIHMNKLATSNNYSIEHEYEIVYLVKNDGQKIIIGDFYGDPNVAIIDSSEKWCAIGGCGLIVYWLKAPFDEYRYDTDSSQYFEFARNKPDILWVEKLKQTGLFNLEILTESGETLNKSFKPIGGGQSTISQTI